MAKAEIRLVTNNITFKNTKQFLLIKINKIFNKHIDQIQSSIKTATNKAVLVNGQPSANYQVDWRRMLSGNRKSHVLGHMMVLRIFGALKSYTFRKTL